MTSSEPARSIPCAPVAHEPSDLRALLDLPVTVTEFLETIAGESIFADVVRQNMVTAEPGNDLEVSTGQVVTRRITILLGRGTHRPFLYAETSFVPERLPEHVVAQLNTTDDPIGRVLVTHGVMVGREPLPGCEARAPRPEVKLDAEVVFARAYRLVIDGSPVFAIREWFLRSVLDALDGRYRGHA